MVGVGETPEEEAKVEAVDVSGGADNGGAESGIGGEKMALLLSLRSLFAELHVLVLPLLVAVADGDD